MNLYALLLAVQLCRVKCVDDDLFITNYFVERRVFSVIGFTCGDNETSKFESTRLFNNNGQSVKIHELQNGTIETLSILRNQVYKVGIFVTKKCQDQDLLKLLYDTGTEYFLFCNMYKWLILTMDANGTARALNDTYFSAETDVIVAVPNNNEYVLYEAYNLGKLRGGQLQVYNVGTWKPDGLDATFYDKNTSRRWNYERMTLKISGLIVYRPDSIDISDYLQRYENIEKDTMTKFHFAVMLHVADIFNFTLEAGEYRSWDPTDDVGPVVKGLHHWEIDISGSPCIMTEERSKYINYLYPVWPFRTFFIFRTPCMSHVRLTEFLMPLAMVCWYYTGFLTIGSIIVFGAVLAYENINVFDRMEAYGVGFIITIGSLCQQGSAYIPIKTPGRVAFFNIMLFSLLLYNYYSASVVSTRLDKPLNKINDSLVELAKTDLKLGAEPSLFFNFIINQTEWELSTFSHTRWSKIPEQERFVLVEEGIRRVREGGFAYHTVPEAGYPLIERTFDNRKICELTEVHIARPQFLYTNTRLDSPFSEILRLGCIKMFERGLLQRLITRWRTRTPECRRDVYTAESITMVEVAPSFFLWIFGVILSLLIFLTERAIYYKHHKRGKQSNKQKNFSFTRLKELWQKQKVLK